MVGIAPSGPEKIKRWAATVNIDGWPHDIILWGDYEMDIFKQLQGIFAAQGAVLVEPK